MVVVTRIETGLWNKILADRISQGWHIVHEYDGFDKGIDSDFIVLKRNDEEMYFGWTNWFEGEIKCTEEQRTFLEQRYNLTFAQDEPKQLTERRIAFHLPGKQGP